MKKSIKIDVFDLLNTFVHKEYIHQFLISLLENNIVAEKANIKYYQEIIDTLEPGYKYQKPEYSVKIRDAKKIIALKTQALKLLRQYITLADKADSL